MNKRNRSCVRTLLPVLLCVLSLLSALPVNALATEQPKVVRVGYYENEVFQEGAAENKRKTGYAYEYYRKLSEYTGWRYQYVYGSFSDLYQMLLDGSVDVLAGLAKTPEREGLLSYPEQPMGSETYSLVKHSGDRSILSDVSSLSGKSIGVLDSNLRSILNRYLKEHGVQAHVSPFSDYQDLFSAFDAGEVDVLAAEGDGAYGRDDAEIIGSFGSSDYYLCVSIHRPDLLVELNDAQTQLSEDDPGYLNTLRQRYYSRSMAVRAFTKRELAWLNEHNTLRLGYLNHYLPYSDTDQSGRVTGLVCELMPKMLGGMGLSALDVKYIGYESYQEMLDALADEQVDAVFPVGGGLYYAEENDLFQSSPVLSSAMDLVYKGTYSDSSVAHFAVNENNLMQYYYIITYYPDARVSFFPSIEKCLEAVKLGKVSCTIVNGLRYNDLLRSSIYDELSAHQLSHTDVRCFGVKIGNESLLQLLNRGISVLDEDYAPNLAYHYTSQLYHPNLIDYIRSNLAAVSICGVLVLLLATVFVVRDASRAREQIRVQKQARQELEEKNRALEDNQRVLEDMNEIVSDAGLGVWHIRLTGEEPQMEASAGMLEMLDLDGEPLDGETLYQLWYEGIVPEDRLLVRQATVRMNRGKLTKLTYRWRKADGSVIALRVGGLAKPNSKGESVLRGYITDVTTLLSEERT